MKLALISPKGVAMGTNKENSKTAAIYENLYGIDSLKELMACPNSPLLTIAAIVNDYFDEINYFDEEYEEIKLFDDYDVIAMSFMTQQASRAFELAVQLKERGSYLVCGGMHPTNSVDETLRYFDTVFVGEGEKTWPAFIKDFEAGKPERVYHNKEVIDMKSVPMPRYDLLKMENYRTIPVQISRGCPHNCEFCSSTKVYGPQYRHKSIEQIIAEVNEIRKYKKHPHIYFTDDNMLVNRTFSYDLLRELEKLKIRWMTHTDISVADDDRILEHLHSSGCSKLVIGFESIIPESLKNLELWKYKRLSNYGESIKKIQERGVGIWGTFIVGLDNDDKSVFQKVVDFTFENNLYGAMISVPTPFPGSKLFERLEKEGRILSHHWGSYTLWNVVVEPKQLTVKELEEGFEFTLNQIYSQAAVKRRLENFKSIYRSL